MKEERKLIDENGIRTDGRKWDELRPIRIEVGQLHNADGSAYIEMGKNKIAAAVYGPNHPVLSIFGLRFPLGIDLNYPVDANRRFFSVATRDIHAAKSWRFRDRVMYAAASYSHTALALATLERLLTTNVMDRALRLYADRWRFRHPTLADFIQGSCNKSRSRAYQPQPGRRT